MRAGTSVVFLPCSDICATKHFYCGILGFPVAERQSDRLMILDTGYGYWGFCQYGDGRPLLSGRQGVCLSVNLESEQAVLARYKQLKDRCRVYQEPCRHPRFPVFSFFVEDPDGYLVEFQKTDSESN